MRHDMVALIALQVTPTGTPADGQNERVPRPEARPASQPALEAWYQRFHQLIRLANLEVLLLARLPGTNLAAKHARVKHARSCKNV